MAEQFALISVSNKSGVERVARALVEVGYRIISTGGTAAHLREHGVNVTSVSEITGFPEIMDGRVKTLHPRIHGALLARRDREDDLATMDDHNIPNIDVVVVNLYPFREVIARTGTKLADALENIDIGGPCMVRAAAKNFSAVSIITDPTDYDRFIATLATGGPDPSMRRELALKAFTHTARYDAAIAAYLGHTDDVPSSFAFVLETTESLRYGENPHQHAALYRVDDEPELGGFVQLHGKQLSYNNIIDLDAACALVDEFEQPAAAVIKHTNPAGCATAASVELAFERALACDPMSAFGGIITLNRALNRAVAEQISESFFEIVAAPSFDRGALEVLMKKKDLRLLTIPSVAEGARWTFRPTRLGWLGQTIDPPVTSERDALDVPTARAPSDDEWRDLNFAWRVCKHVKSNAIVLARDGASIGVGAGQMSRVDSVELAIRKTRGETVGSVLASDAFFPFRDGPDAAAAAGIRAIIQPGGSRRDEEVIAACDEHDIAMVFTGKRHFRH